MRCEILHDAGAFDALASAWDDLATATDVGLFLSHRWLSAWWRAYRGADELWMLTLRDGERLVAAWPLHLSAPRSGPIRIAALRLVGDFGGAQRSILCAQSDEEQAAAAFMEALAEARDWDVLDVPVAGVRRAEALERALAERGPKADRVELAGRSYADLPPSGEWDELVQARRQRPLSGVRWELAPEPLRGLDDLLRLLRKEWATKEAASPAADPQAAEFLSGIVPELVASGRATIGLLVREGVGVIAADLVVRDRDRCVELLRTVDPEFYPKQAAVELQLGALQVAAQAGAHRFEFAPSPSPSPSSDDDEPLLCTGVGKVLRLRLWNSTTAGRLHHRVESLKGALRSTDALKALERIREAAPEMVQRTVAKIATYATLHLYRGELFTRDVTQSGDLVLRLFGRADFDRLKEREREEFVARLDLQPGYCRQKWERGDMVVLAETAGRPAGIVWCARMPVYVPDIGREVRPAVGECYIHDVYVHPDERGRKIAPAMLDFLSRELRSRDVYRAWALIERTNTSSTRAFERAAYASVADVIYARMGLISRIIVTPPDPEARAFLGLP
jgi:ribosomal protein S18 acetylase RimI-like enzyme